MLSSLVIYFWSILGSHLCLFVLHFWFSSPKFIFFSLPNLLKHFQLLDDEKLLQHHGEIFILENDLNILTCDFLPLHSIVIFILIITMRKKCLDFKSSERNSSSFFSLLVLTEAATHAAFVAGNLNHKHLPCSNFVLNSSLYFETIYSMQFHSWDCHHWGQNARRGNVFKRVK